LIHSQDKGRLKKPLTQPVLQF